MTRTKKPPTLADLRRLAKRKGMKPDFYQYGNNEHLSVFIAGVSGTALVGGYKSEVPNIREVIFAALSALPDAPKKASRHE